MAQYITEGEKVIASDHIFIHITFSYNPLTIPTTPKFNYNRADWAKFKQHMENLPLPNIILKNTIEIDTQLETLIKSILMELTNLFQRPHSKSYQLSLILLNQKSKNYFQQ